MPYYTVTRKYTMTETLIVKAKSKYDAFEKAGDDIDCHIQREIDGDYEPDYQSISEVAYVSDKTKERIG